MAIKVVEHNMEGDARVVEGARESLLAVSVAHPNVVRPNPPPFPPFCPALMLARLIAVHAHISTVLTSGGRI